MLNDAGLNIVHYPNDHQLIDNRFDGATDIPVILHYQKLFRMFPKSKFVLTTRNIDEWIKSVVPYLERKRKWNQSKRQIDIRTKVYGVPYPDEHGAYYAFKRHEKSVKEFFKDSPDRFIEINIVNGYDKPKKLFDFLGLENPPDDWPHENKLEKK